MPGAHGLRGLQVNELVEQTTILRIVQEFRVDRLKEVFPLPRLFFAAKTKVILCLKGSAQEPMSQLSHS